MLNLIRSESLAGLAQAVCDSIVDEPIYVLACVGVPLDAPGKPIKWLAAAGRANGYQQELALSWSADVPEGRGPTGNAIRDGRPHVMRDALTDPGYAPWRDRCSQYDIRSSVTVPCRKGERVVGVLLIYSDIPGAFGLDELELFQRLSDEIGFAIALDEERSRMRGAETARQEAEENLSAAVQLGPGVLYRARVTAAGLQVLHVFGDTARITGGEDCKVCGPATLDSMLSSPSMLTALRALNGEAVQTIEAPVPLCGATRWLRNAVRVTAHDPGGIEVTGYLSEVTEEKRDQLHRQHVATLLTLGEMATGMAHELNQPLTSISFAAQNVDFLLGRQPADVANAQAKVRKIISEAGRASKLVEHMRVFARNERGALVRASWRTALNAASEILSAKLRGCVLHDEVPAGLPDVLGAAIPMEQVLINLIANAVDAYDAQPNAAVRDVTVSASVQGDAVLLRVSDHAGGIPEAALTRVFEPFFTTKAPGKGTGLGLALTFGTITEMGGTITASNANGGAVFEIQLPIATQ